MPNEQGNLSECNGTERRDILKGLGAGALALPFMTGTTTAEQNMDLRVSVEAGEGDADNWTRRDYLTDEFKARVDISGLSGGESKVAVMTFPVGGSNYVTDGQLRATTFKADWTDGSGYFVHGTPWTPGGPLGKWDSGTFYLYTVVAEDREESFGAAVSEPFEVNP